MGGPGWWERLLFGVSILALAWFYVWTVAPAGTDTLVDAQSESYYNLLARGLLKGQLSLDAAVDPALADMPDPYDPVARGSHGLHDATYYKGKYYIYFGITPVLVLYLPFHVLTGTYLTDAAVVAIFALLGFLCAWTTLVSIIRARFPQTGLTVRLACLWALGLANMVPPLLRRPAMWEVPIACAYALFMFVLYCLWRARDERTRLRWTLVASVAMGLCVGARPTYLAGSVVLLVPLAAWGFVLGWRCWSRREWWTLVVATALPIALVGVGLALYNYLRFENPLEFGQTYQMAGVKVGELKTFGLEYLPFNLRIYLFSSAGFSPYFPFFTVIDVPPAPPGQFGVEDPYGIIPGMPWVLLVLFAVRRALCGRDALGWWCAGVLAAAVLNLLTVGCFGGNTGRYQVDFTPALVLLGAVGLVWQAATVAGWARKGVVLLAAGLAMWSGIFNFFLSLQHNRLLEADHPAVYARLARFFNHLPHAMAKVTGQTGGPVEIRLVFPQDKRGRIEPLVVTGHQFLSDYLFVHYIDPGVIRFGLEHTSRGSWTGPATRIDPGAEHTVVVQMGSLHPPAEHPFYDSLSPAEKDRRTREVKVLLNDRTVLQLTTECYDASDWQPSIGTSRPDRPALRDDFSGQILGWRRLPPLPPDRAERTTGRLHLLLRLPAFTRPRSEPLLCTGEAGKGDLIYIRYLDATRFQIGHDRWGHGGSIGPVIEYDPNLPLDIDIACPPLLGEGAPPRLLVTLNGSPLIDVEEPFHPSRPTQIAVGRNLIGASTAEEGFTGIIELQERVAP